MTEYTSRTTLVLLFASFGQYVNDLMHSTRFAYSRIAPLCFELLNKNDRLSPFLQFKSRFWYNFGPLCDSFFLP